MERITIEQFNFQSVRLFSLPHWEQGAVTVSGEDHRVELYQVTQKQIRDEIRSYVRSMGYSAGDLESISAFLSELADDTATARTRVEDDLARKAAAAD
jgi:hypothetical protein